MSDAKRYRYKDVSIVIAGVPIAGLDEDEIITIEADQIERPAMHWHRHVTSDGWRVVEWLPGSAAACGCDGGDQ